MAVEAVKVFVSDMWCYTEYSYCFVLMCKCAVICVGLAARPVSASQSETRPKLPSDAHLPRGKYAGVKSSGYSRRLSESKPTASKSAYSPAVKPRAGKHSAWRNVCVWFYFIWAYFPVMAFITHVHLKCSSSWCQMMKLLITSEVTCSASTDQHDCNSFK